MSEFLLVALRCDRPSRKVASHVPFVFGLCMKENQLDQHT